MFKPFVNRPLFLRFGLFTACLLFAGSTFAQYQVSQPGEAGPNAKPDNANSPNRQPGIELNGNNNRDKPVRYPTQTGYLPSEILIATQRSGATPSELRTQADAVGPLSSNGPADYIPGLSPLQRAVGATPPVLFGPAYFNSHAMSFRNAGPIPSGVINPDPVQAGINRAKSNETSPSNVTPGPVYTQQPVSTQIFSGRAIGPVTAQEGTVSHPLHYLRPPSTQPTTQPSENHPSLAPTVNPAPR